MAHQSKSRDVEATLMQPELHECWENAYHTPENSQFYDAAIEYVGQQLDPKVRPVLLDAGCGVCDYSIRLAKQGFRVTAVDFSEPVLVNAKANLAANEYRDLIKLQREDLTKLRFADSTFDSVFCWGVLMHIPDLESAIAELVRVLKPGGRLALTELNMFSVEAIAKRFVRRFSGSPSSQIKLTSAGLEHWKKLSYGEIMTRWANVDWLINRLEELGLEIQNRKAAQFSEAYVHIKGRRLKRLIYRFNQLWFDRIGWAQPAIANILIFEKRVANGSDSSPKG